MLGLWQADLLAGLDSVGTVGRVSTPGRLLYIELIVPSQTQAQTGTGKKFMLVVMYVVNVDFLM